MATKHESNGAKAPLPHDGWGSRKVIACLSALAVLTGIATTALFLGVAGFDQWASFEQWLCGVTLSPMIIGIGVDKLAEARRLG
jgi:hypothetical protein